MIHAYSLLIQDEKQIEVHVAAHPFDTAFMVTNTRFSTVQKSNNNQQFLGAEGKFKPYFDNQKCGMYRTYCKMTNHVVANCYRLIGFPVNFKFTKSKRLQPLAHNNATSVGPTTKNVQSVQGMDTGTSANLITQEQYSQLFQLHQEVKL